ncbi:ATP-binding cassette domain-containing protein [Halomicrobium mukohataei]|uniref:ATP-binding cassette domain-containing protein n=1 Tax=Halomicrobium mukohataei TaxID=57705 RepID=A0A847UDQ9_9EURY|nr:ATP-binding cassette domain-containing protein [Halomicrobium mukohataei]NLV09141.1 ATP-binding cassette domain-containing protein [Halomicrobium mukohataei]
MNLVIDGVGKQYGSDKWGVKNVDLEVGTGVHGLLGPNGAGKSTLMQVLTTVMKPTEGTVYWNDTDIVELPGTVRSVLGYLPQNPGVYPNLTLEEFLEYMAAIRGLDPEERVRFRNVLSELAADRVVILSTHIVPDTHR